jgi:hypothetical protein
MPENEIPKWWEDYKKENPTDKDEYNPSKHCCRRFWKDFCDCIKNPPAPKDRRWKNNY